MPSVEYSVDLVDGAWTVGLGEKRFGPYSTLDKAVAAAVAAAEKAEVQGYQAVVKVNAAPGASEGEGPAPEALGPDALRPDAHGQETASPEAA